MNNDEVDEVNELNRRIRDLEELVRDLFEIIKKLEGKKNDGKLKEDQDANRYSSTISGK